MKNIHLIPTDKPSRLSILNSGKLNFGAEFISSSNSKAQNIYITSDEEIKEGDWYFITESISKCESKYEANDLTDICKKIILTTDTELIADGVQAIDDEFLEWFLKNPSCEEVNIVKEKQHIGEEVDESYPRGFFDYKIIIPKEEPKQYNNLNYGGGFTEEDIKRVSEKKPKQETLEEAAERLAYDSTEENKGFPSIKKFIQGAKWQAERMYSDMEEYAEFCINCYEKGLPHIRSKDWFEQFKKK